ncbi:ASCH domain-containing protein [Pelomonas sp. APW6]|uniref:ASCH domain-containing protein n=1 Tax=Roseateles subflavus TaxID=3053353 RepID=A0ABT7LJF8_9BURK|nr:ASCH domain-containing protein [Pelomonas sp. APW6]MDL5032987.1 ASCH domain-containing protein [Pelomonas sp. APW6]
MPIPAHLRDYWQAFSASVGGVDDARFFEACTFGDSQALADELAALVLKGVKRGTAASVGSFEAQGLPLPKPGDLSVMLDGSGAPVGVIETRSIEVLPFKDVTAAFAAVEGEGDGSLAYWREAHRAYFTREADAAGRTFSEDLLVCCECFDLVYPHSAGQAAGR